ncbi:probable xyloglucan endotransglucosylase/hydrolase protein 30 [Oryza brachyantha]|uniref:probable xyloglucan endotransglucosylase/hydrolase protein 30 n=1 Tax=Oryza brachyantha TaxID=4533 RepID=UPI001AD9A961|nr:probable xyloglucan endotransglucosylase/hydrolase protein 30 [Oryza brachyantha]
MHPRRRRSMAAAAAVWVWVCMSMVAVRSAADGLEDVPTIAFEEGFSPLFGEDNMEKSADGRTVSITLNRYTGSGFISSDYYHHGFFSASIKLPKDHTAGVVVAFYLSNGDVFEKTHDELDFEFLGNRYRHEWKMQTNVYGNGSTDRGREERYLMPFDPTADAHRFSILWSSRLIVFYVDGVPIREVPRSPAMGADYPSKPMALYVTIWDGSTWATDNGKYKVNYKRGPFTAVFSDLVLRGCRARSDIRLASVSADEQDRCAAEEEEELMSASYATMTARKRLAMRRFRQRQMLYTVCYDTNRYPEPFPECDVNMAERQMYWQWGESKVVRPRVRPRPGRRSKRRPSPFPPPPVLVSLQQAD